MDGELIGDLGWIRGFGIEDLGIGIESIASFSPGRAGTKKEIDHESAKARKK